MIQGWALIVADFRREYGLTADNLHAMSSREFRWLLTGLSPDARWVEWARAQPRVVTSEAETQAIFDRL